MNNIETLEQRVADLETDLAGARDCLVVLISFLTNRSVIDMDELTEWRIWSKFFHNDEEKAELYQKHHASLEADIRETFNEKPVTSFD